MADDQVKLDVVLNMPQAPPVPPPDTQAAEAALGRVRQAAETAGAAVQNALGGGRAGPAAPAYTPSGPTPGAVMPGYWQTTPGARGSMWNWGTAPPGTPQMQTPYGPGGSIGGPVSPFSGYSDPWGPRSQYGPWSAAWQAGRGTGPFGAIGERDWQTGPIQPNMVGGVENYGTVRGSLPDATSYDRAIGRVQEYHRHLTSLHTTFRELHMGAIELAAGIMLLNKSMEKGSEFDNNSTRLTAGLSILTGGASLTRAVGHTMAAYGGSSSAIAGSGVALAAAAAPLAIFGPAYLQARMANNDALARGEELEGMRVRRLEPEGWGHWAGRSVLNNIAAPVRWLGQGTGLWDFPKWQYGGGTDAYEGPGLAAHQQRWRMMGEGQIQGAREMGYGYDSDQALYNAYQGSFRGRLQGATRFSQAANATNDMGRDYGEIAGRVRGRIAQGRDLSQNGEGVAAQAAGVQAEIQGVQKLIELQRDYNAARREGLQRQIEIVDATRQEAEHKREASQATNRTIGRIAPDELSRLSALRRLPLTPDVARAIEGITGYQEGSLQSGLLNRQGQARIDQDPRLKNYFADARTSGEMAALQKQIDEAKQQRTQLMNTIAATFKSEGDAVVRLHQQLVALQRELDDLKARLPAARNAA